MEQRKKIKKKTGKKMKFKEKIKMKTNEIRIAPFRAIVCILTAVFLKSINISSKLISNISKN